MLVHRSANNTDPSDRGTHVPSLSVRTPVPTLTRGVLSVMTATLFQANNQPYITGLCCVASGQGRRTSKEQRGVGQSRGAQRRAWQPISDKRPCKRHHSV